LFLAKGKKSKEKGFKKTLIAVILALVVAGGVAAGILLSGGKPSDYGVALGGEYRDTMSPGRFTGKTAKAYWVAKQIPEILDNVYCYCHCQENHAHKSLKTCFVDRHGSMCGVCMDEAIMSYDLYKKGYDTKDIVEKVDAFFSKKFKR